MRAGIAGMSQRERFAIATSEHVRVGIPGLDAGPWHKPSAPAVNIQPVVTCRYTARRDESKPMMNGPGTPFLLNYLLRKELVRFYSGDTR